MERTCFFVTPIGKEESDERKQADFLMENTLKYVCMQHDMELLRADQLSGTGDINSDIMELLHTADMCVVDLTGLNPNVMFELGMRIEIKKSLVIIAKRGTELPFDIHSYRIIFFDNIEQSVNNSNLISTLTEYFSISAKRGFKAESTPSLKDIYTMLLEIRSSCNLPTYQTEANKTSVLDSDSDVEMLLGSLNPTEAFLYAFQIGKIQTAEKLLEYLPNNNDEYYRNKICALAAVGSQKSMSKLETMLPGLLDEKNFDVVHEVLGSLISGYMRNDIEKQKMGFITPIFDKAMKLAEKNSQKASIYNQMQRLYAGGGDYKKAAEYAKKAINLCDDKPAYVYNYATVLEKLGNADEAKEQIKKCLRITNENGEQSEDYLFFACKLFKGSQDGEERQYFDECYRKLLQINPFKAKLIDFENN